MSMTTCCVTFTGKYYSQIICLDIGSCEFESLFLIEKSRKICLFVLFFWGVFGLYMFRDIMSYSIDHFFSYHQPPFLYSYNIYTLCSCFMTV